MLYMVYERDYDMSHIYGIYDSIDAAIERKKVSINADIKEIPLNEPIEDWL